MCVSVCGAISVSKGRPQTGTAHRGRILKGRRFLKAEAGPEVFRPAVVPDGPQNPALGKLLRPPFQLSSAQSPGLNHEGSLLPFSLVPASL